MHFLFEEGLWTGSGSVTFSHSPETLYFTMKWNISEEANTLKANQEVHIDDLPPMINTYTISSSHSGQFSLTLSNEALGSFEAKGLLDEHKIAWEFAHPGLLDGLEVYERISDSEYLFHSEYTGGDGFITKISGSMKQHE